LFLHEFFLCGRLFASLLGATDLARRVGLESVMQSHLIAMDALLQHARDLEFPEIERLLAEWCSTRSGAAVVLSSEERASVLHVLTAFDARFTSLLQALVADVCAAADLLPSLPLPPPPPASPATPAAAAYATSSSPLIVEESTVVTKEKLVASLNLLSQLQLALVYTMAEDDTTAAAAAVSGSTGTSPAAAVVGGGAAAVVVDSKQTISDALEAEFPERDYEYNSQEEDDDDDHYSTSGSESGTPGASAGEAGTGKDGAGNGDGDGLVANTSRKGARPRTLARNLGIAATATATGSGTGRSGHSGGRRGGGGQQDRRKFDVPDDVDESPTSASETAAAAAVADAGSKEKSGGATAARFLDFSAKVNATLLGVFAGVAGGGGADATVGEQHHQQQHNAAGVHGVQPSSGTLDDSAAADAASATAAEEEEEEEAGSGENKKSDLKAQDTKVRILFTITLVIHRTLIHSLILRCFSRIHFVVFSWTPQKAKVLVYFIHIFLFENVLTKRKPSTQFNRNHADDLVWCDNVVHIIRCTKGCQTHRYEAAHQSVR
jgi:hypothetical protein